MSNTSQDITKLYAESRKRLHDTKGDMAYHLEVFGDTLAEQQGYKDIEGMDAIYLYLIRTHHWLPRDIRSMNAEDIQLALHVEMQGWTVPEAKRQPAKRSGK